MKEASSTHVIGTLGLMVPHLVVKKKPCNDIKTKEQNVTRLPIPGSLLDLKKSTSITFLQYCMYYDRLLHKKLKEYHVGCTTDQHDEYYECDCKCSRHYECTLIRSRMPSRITVFRRVNQVPVCRVPRKNSLYNSRLNDNCSIDDFLTFPFSPSVCFVHSSSSSSTVR